MFDTAFLDLPLSTLVTLVAGYAGYYIANNGQVVENKASNVIFSTLCFGLIAHVVYGWFVIDYLGSQKHNIAIVPAFIITISVAIIWRKYGRDWFYKALKYYSISNADNTPSAWIQFYEDTKTDVYEVNVKLKNGSVLHSKELYKFNGLPNGPFCLGPHGDVVLYVTDEYDPKTNEWIKHDDILNEHYGNYATYIPASEIHKISLRRLPK